MTPVRLKFCDPPSGFNWMRLERLLRQKFEIAIDIEAPDFIIYSVAGHEHLKYPDAVRIFFTAENVVPDFNLCDYAFGFQWIEFGDRYYRCPNYVLYEHYGELVQRRQSSVTADDLVAQKTAFCNFIYTNSNANPTRDALFGALNDYRSVDGAGAHLNTLGHTIGKAYAGDWTSEKVAFQRRYRFSIAAENASSPGYTTEKIVHALAADTIPIYFGDPLVARDFNAARFINCQDYGSLDAVVARVRDIDHDDRLFLDIVNAPFFPGNTPPASLAQGSLLDQFSAMFSGTKQQAMRRSRHVWGPMYEQQRIREVEAAQRLAANGAICGTHTV